MSKRSLLLTFGFFLMTHLTSPTAEAKLFANQFVEFDLPPNWACLLEGAEWVCQNQQDATKKKEAIIILAAKIQGDQDTLDQYGAYLKNPKVYTTPKGKSVTSEVRYARNQTIMDHPWVDALHLESEIPGFYTRYLATVKEGIGVLVTYSVNKNKYPEYSTMFDSMIKSLKVFRREGGLNASGIGGATSNLFANSKPPAAMTSDTFNAGIPAANTEAPKPKKKGGLLDDPMVLYGAAGVGGLLLLTALKKMKK